MANNPFDPQLVQIRKTLSRGGLSTVNRGFGSLKTTPTRTRQAPSPEPAEWWPENLSELNDVDVTTDPPTNGQSLVWSSSAGMWIPATVSGGGGSTSPPTIRDRVDSPPLTPSAWDDEFNDSVFDTGKWSVLAPSTETYVEDELLLTVSYNANENRMRGIYQTAPASPFIIRAKIWDAVIGDLADRSHLGIFCGASTSATLYLVGVWGGDEHRTISYATGGSGTATSAGSLRSLGIHPYFYTEIQFNGTTTFFRTSLDGENWFTTHSVSLVPTIFGVGWMNNRNYNLNYRYEWFRCTV